MPVIYDAYGREVDTKALRRPPIDDRRGAARLVDRYTSWLIPSPTPKKLAAILREAETGDVARQSELFATIYERDGHVRAEMGKRIAALVGLPWEVSSTDESDQRAKEIAGFVKETLEGLKGFSDTQRRLAVAIGRGYALEEVTWRSDGRYYLPALHEVDASRLTFSNSLIPLLITDAAPTGEELEPWRSLYHVHKSLSGHEARGGVLRTVAWYYLFKHHGLKDWMIFLEAYGVPYRIGKYDASMTDEERRRFEASIRALGVDGAGIISKEAEVEIIEAASRTGASPHKPLVDVCNAEISKAIVGQTLSAEVGTRGALATAQVHDQVRRDLTEDDARALAQTIQDQLISPLVGFNFGWDSPTPRYYLRLPKTPEQLKARGEVLGQAIKDGFPVTQEVYSRWTDIPLPGEGETVITRPEPASAAGLSHRMAQAGRREYPLDDEIETATDLAASLGLDQEVSRLVEGAESYEALEAGLARLHGNRSRAEFQALLAQALILADLKGRAREVR